MKSKSSSSADIFPALRERGFVQQHTGEAEISALFGAGPVTFYAGIDPTADSLHVGHLVPVMAMAHLQRAGHRPIALIGGGTALVGDPSGKSEMRQMISRDEVEANCEAIRVQLEGLLSHGEPVCLNNADWLCTFRYIDFLRDIGRHFRVNEMLRAEAYRQRLEREEGLSFIEFNYQLLQAYDFLHLFREHGCTLQVGGDDQWGNIIAGTELIRRLEGANAHGLTCPLLTTAGGGKMGKTAEGAVWLSPERTSPYEYFQYWINTDDRDVERFLALFTFLPMDEIRRLGALEGADLREAKDVLAFEATRVVHGEDEAAKAREASRAAFGGAPTDVSSLPTTKIDRARLEGGIPILDLLCETGLTASRKEAKRLVKQGGVSLNDAPVTATDLSVGTDALVDGALMLRQGKKQYHRVVVS